MQSIPQCCHRVDGCVEGRTVWKLDLQTLRFFLGGYKIFLRDIGNGSPVAELPFLAFRILQPVRSLEGSTHFGVLPESSSEHKPLKRRLWQNS